MPEHDHDQEGYAHQKESTNHGNDQELFGDGWDHQTQGS
jgi:hypothetical protein